MSFVSLAFLIFLPIVVLVFWFTPPRFRWIPLLLASYLFYGFVKPWLVLLLMAMTLVSYVGALLLERSQNVGMKRFWLILGLVLSFGTLFVFKYLAFFLDSLFSLWGGSSPLLALALPVGISFYTFQCVSYLLDVYHGSCNVEKHFGYFALFVSFFPQLVAGPIERSKDLLPQLKHTKAFDGSYLQEALPYLASGFFKKIVIADYLAPFVESVYANPAAATSPMVALSTILFAFQIYCDFSGYCDIAMGAAKCLAIDLSPNFLSPYLATNIQDFWRRWHISLTRWFTEYVYIPLGGNRKGLPRQCLNIFIIFLLSGLWHGANWTFILWGALHGFYLVVYLLWHHWRAKSLQKSLQTTQNPLRLFGGWILTFLAVCFAWIFFRSPSLGDAFLLLRNLFTYWGDGFASIPSMMSFTWGDGIKCVVLLAILFYLSKFLKKEDEASVFNRRFIFDNRYFTYFFFVGVIALAWMMALANHADTPFIYFDF